MKIDLRRAFEDGIQLLQRYDEGEGFHRYVKSRLPIIAPMAALILLTGIVFASATIVSAGTRFWLSLPAMLLAPVVLLGSVFVQAYLFFAWLENRAIARTLGHALAKPGPLAVWVKRNLRAELGAPPAVTWELAAIFLGLPMLLLAVVSWKVALALALVHLAALVVYARLDRPR